VCLLVADELILLTSAMEDAEFQFKAPVEFVTDSIRETKLNDCSFDSNCRAFTHTERSDSSQILTQSSLFVNAGWFRDAVNDLFRVFQNLITLAEHATISCFISAGCFFLGTICTNGFACRLRRNVVKVYSGR